MSRHSHYSFPSNLSTYHVKLHRRSCFQAQRCASTASAEGIRLAKTPLDARRFAEHTVPLSHWDNCRRLAMVLSVKGKLHANPELVQRLLDTKDYTWSLLQVPRRCPRVH